jgi:hypothetical protein
MRKRLVSALLFVAGNADGGCEWQLTQIISDKEKKSSVYKAGKLDSLSEEKSGKIKKFAKEYIAKVLRKVEKSKSRKPSASGSGSGLGPSSRDPRTAGIPPPVDSANTSVAGASSSTPPDDLEDTSKIVMDDYESDNEPLDMPMGKLDDDDSMAVDLDLDADTPLDDSPASETPASEPPSKSGSTSPSVAADPRLKVKPREREPAKKTLAVWFPDQEGENA